MRTDTDNFMSRFIHASHQRQEKVVKREIEIAELADFHGKGIPASGTMRILFVHTQIDAFISRECHLDFAGTFQQIQRPPLYPIS